MDDQFVRFDGKKFDHIQHHYRTLSLYSFAPYVERNVMQFLPSKSGRECALMRRFKPWWHGTLGPNRIRILYSITFASRRRRIRYEMNVDPARKSCIWRCEDDSNCGRWNVNQVRVKEGNRSGRWVFKCSCGKKKRMDSEDPLWASNQIDAWTIVADFRSIEE